MGTRRWLLLVAFAWGAAACTPVVSDPSYTMEVRLHDGKHVRCAINEPLVRPAPPGPALTTRERNEAEVLALAPMRLEVGPRSPYPTPYTAPDVQCLALPL